MGHPSIHQLLLGYIPQYDLDDVLGLCDAFCPDPKKGAQVAFLFCTVSVWNSRRVQNG